MRIGNHKLEGFKLVRQLCDKISEYMNWDCLHLIKGNTINVLYHYPTFNLAIINDESYKIIDYLKAGSCMRKDFIEYKIKNNPVLSYIESLQESIHEQIKVDNTLNRQRRRIHRITLHVSNDCNLRCKYCYANGGNYNQSRNLMTESTAKAFVDFCIENFEVIEQIAFFGGEPLLNVEIMKYICYRFKLCYSKGLISFIPQFGIITNGTILSSEILLFVKNNISEITISVDGPQKVNDANRVYKNGKGSYADIHHFITTIKKETKVPIRYEATFTQYHRENQYEYKDITNFFFNEFGIRGSIERENSLEPDSFLDYWKIHTCDDLIENDLMEVPEGFWGILDVLVRKNKREICPIIKDIFAVSVDGDIYACHMLNGIIENNLGNIKTKHIFNTPSLYASCSTMLHLKQNPICEKCWGEAFCSGCAVKKFYKKGQKCFVLEPKIELCKLFLEHLEHVLLMIATIRTKPGLWSALIAKLNQRVKD